MTVALCQCGCGQPVRFAQMTSKATGRIKGQPNLFILGHSMKGRKQTEAARRKVSEAQMGKQVSEETRRKISEAQRGKSRGNGGAKNPAWKGGRIRRADGYVRVWLPSDHRFAEHRNPKGYVYEHRLVWAEKTGTWPVIRNSAGELMDLHHINGDTSDNRFENLALMTRTAHKRSHRRRELASI